MKEEDREPKAPCLALSVDIVSLVNECAGSGPS